MYNWGSVGRHNELASVLQRIDFGLPDMTAEGVAAAKSLVQPSMQASALNPTCELRICASTWAPIVPVRHTAVGELQRKHCELANMRARVDRVTVPDSDISILANFQ